MENQFFEASQAQEEIPLKHFDMPDGIQITLQEGAISPENLEVLVRYWTRKEGKFVGSVQQLGKSVGVSANKMPAFLSELPSKTTLHREGLVCVHCGARPVLKSRADYQFYERHVARFLDTDGYCQECATWHKPVDPNGSWIMGHLSRTQIDELVRRYYAQDDCVALVNDYLIELDPIEFADNLHATMQYGKCRHCGQEYSFLAPSQIEYKSGHAERLLSCSKCEHEASIEIEQTGFLDESNYGLSFRVVESTDASGMVACTCRGCETERLRDPIRRRQSIQEAYTPPKKPVEIQSLSLRDIVCLLGLLWNRSPEEKTNIALTPDAERLPLTPQDRVTWDWMRVFTDSQAVYVNPDTSPLNAFKEDKVSTYFMDKVNYLVNVTLDGEVRASPAQLLSALVDKFRKGYWQNSWTDELLPLWFDIAISECMAYVEDRAYHYKLDVPNEEKLREIFMTLLEDFSVSRIWYMISTAYFSAAAFSRSDKCMSLAHAVNTVPSKIISLSEQPSIKIRQWSRTPEIPRCAVTEVLFDIMLGAQDDAGFNLCPGKEWRKLLDHHIAQNLDGVIVDFMAEHPIDTDESLRELAMKYNDPKIEKLVRFAIAARAKLSY
ncbi:hypothetical protein LH452_14770 [Laribacter hongkongensis]|uniref:hypothetical protein n=1 Tax=Laribacter hongkongensis TaxID=168471 RepID=UPI001EFD028A|nr:hypothetical protein [Laribacter hongkongensis]MCG9060149.1 hypothetical protein [Laribacter hongkongensis]MCG9084391.1 hypothetical protein [Laribacter hongkongensis]MCG9087249.1 hypothetical protein [Laribacter hongkongensis]